jgi:hypothetical protein
VGLQGLDKHVPSRFLNRRSHSQNVLLLHRDNEMQTRSGPDREIRRCTIRRKECRSYPNLSDQSWVWQKVSLVVRGVISRAADTNSTLIRPCESAGHTNRRLAIADGRRSGAS